MPTGTAAPPGAAPGTPSLAAFVELMAGQGTPPPAKGATAASGRQSDADPGKPLPDGDDKQPDPALAWMFAAPGVAAPLPVTVGAVGGAASRLVVDITALTAAPGLPMSGPPTDDHATTEGSGPPVPVASPQTASPVALPLLDAADAPPAILVATPVPTGAPVNARFLLTALAAAVAKAVPTSTGTDPAPTVPLAMTQTSPPSPLVPPTTPTAPAPIITADVSATIPATDSTSVAGLQAAAPAMSIRPNQPPSPSLRPPVQIPATPHPAGATAAIQPALFALAGIGERNASDHDDRPTTGGTVDPLAQLQTPASLAVAPTGDAQRQQLDMGQRDWPQKMIEHIETLRDNANATDTSIRLKPEALGRVDVALKTHDDGAISVRFAAEQPATRTMLADAAPQLAQAAEARGIRLSGTSVDLTGSGQGDQRARPEVERRQPTTNHLATPSRGDDTDAVTDGRIA
ncbi:MAG: flagellar hook-length control protein FliK [Sphingomonas sp.]|uniref:flagellar hook-length control protein FliK n=1 Tax=Sphingomonas sp. TaxID=28214 RepID=UPI001ACDF10D|nr:flagellar hook-length control protein FliK [Sphingomonas sp.]MBN8808021.1 flagellar hook-length control protein FliK [Sphingomonas sp.]